MSDEIYEKLVYDPEFRHKSIASVSPEMNELTITINGFSKAYSMPGWRLGYLAAPKWLADRIIAFQSHTTSNPTSFAQYGALAALTGTQEPVEQMRQAFAKRRDLIYSLISAIPGIKTIRPSGAFYLFFDVSSFGLNSTDFVNRLLEEEKVAGVPGKAFGDDHSLRVSYACSEETIREAAARIARFCRKAFQIIFRITSRPEETILRTGFDRNTTAGATPEAGGVHHGYDMGLSSIPDSACRNDCGAEDIHVSCKRPGKIHIVCVDRGRAVLHTAPDDSVGRLARRRIFCFPLSCEINKLSSAAGLSRHGGGDNSCGAALQVPAVLMPVANRETLCRIN